jgi:DNA-binding beta-propeller fold protein YncE
MRLSLATLTSLIVVQTGCFLVPGGGGKNDQDGGTMGPWPGLLDAGILAPATVEGAACNVDSPSDYDTLFLEYAGEEFAFDGHGAFVTVSDWAGAAWALQGDEWQQIAPVTSDEIAGIDYMSNGDLVVADEGNGSLMIITPNGGTSTLLGSINSPNSVAVAASGDVYSTAFDAVLKITPGGEWKEIARIPDQDLDGLVFSPSYDALWFNADAAGDVYRMSLDGDGNEIDTEFIESFDLSTGYQELDGMAMDECGQLYVLRTDGQISRLRADGGVDSNYITVGNGDAYTTSLHFGSGVGEWQRDHLYISDRYGQLFDVDVGINGAHEPHL